MSFASDNAVGCAPQILSALVAVNDGAMPSYGADPVAGRVSARLSDIFETACTVHLVVSGTAANALALSSLVPPWGAVFCHRLAHIEEDECGAVEAMSTAKLCLVDGPDARIDPGALSQAIGDTGVLGVHNVQPAALSLTNVTERGAVYTPAQVAELADIARSAGLWVHMDGARFANALVATNASPAEMTWRAGVDVLSFGATKNGCLAAEAVIFFGKAREKAREFEFRRKRSGHLLSKGRLISAQLEGYLADDLWLRLARHANEQAQMLAQGIEALPAGALNHPADANMVFARMPLAAHRATRALDPHYHLSPNAQTEDGDGETVSVRLVTSFATRPEDVTRFLAAARDGVAAA